MALPTRLAPVTTHLERQTLRFFDRLLHRLVIGQNRRVRVDTDRSNVPGNEPGDTPRRRWSATDDHLLMPTASA
jgi:hypothetical protein